MIHATWNVAVDPDILHDNFNNLISKNEIGIYNTQKIWKQYFLLYRLRLVDWFLTTIKY